MKKLPLFIALLSGPAMADYQLELEVGVRHSEVEERYSPYFDNFREGYETFIGGGTYYFSPVSTETVPLSDAAFVARASGVSFRATSAEPMESEQVSMSGEITWVLRNDFIVGLNYSHYESDEEDVTLTRAGPGIKGGYYLSETSAVILTYQDTTLELDSPYSSLYYFEQPDREIYNVMYKNLVMKDGQAKSDIELTLMKDNFLVELGARVGLFLNNNTKVGVAAKLSDYDYYGDGRTLGIWAEYFPSENIAIAIELERETSASYDDGNYRFEENIAGITSIFRF